MERRRFVRLDFLVGDRRVRVAGQVSDTALAVFPEGDLLPTVLGWEQAPLDLDPALLRRVEIQCEIPSGSSYATVFVGANPCACQERKHLLELGVVRAADAVASGDAIGVPRDTLAGGLEGLWRGLGVVVVHGKL